MRGGEGESKGWCTPHTSVYVIGDLVTEAVGNRRAERMEKDEGSTCMKPGEASTTQGPTVSKSVRSMF